VKLQTCPYHLTFDLEVDLEHIVDADPCGDHRVKFGSDAAISHGFWDIKVQRYWGHDLDLLGSRDVICHVTIGFAIWGFL